MNGPCRHALICLTDYSPEYAYRSSYLVEAQSAPSACSKPRVSQLAQLASDCELRTANCLCESVTARTAR